MKAAAVVLLLAAGLVFAGWLVATADQHVRMVALSPVAQAVAAATFDALMQLDCDQPDAASDHCSDELQNANTAPSVLSIRKMPGGLWRVVLSFQLTGGSAAIPIAETVT